MFFDERLWVKNLGDGGGDSGTLLYASWFFQTAERPCVHSVTHSLTLAADMSVRLRRHQSNLVTGQNSN